MATSATIIHLAGRKFALVASKPTPPQGEYVAHGGGFYPTKTGYPLNVVADIAAGHPERVVLMQTPDGIIAMLSGTDRIIYSRNDSDSTKKIFYKTLLRLTLISESKEVTIVGDITELDNMPFRKVELNDLALPPIIKRARTWKLLATFGLLILAGIITSALLRTSINSSINHDAQTLTAAQAEMADALTAVQPGRTQLKTASAVKKQEQTPPPKGGPLPQIQASFLDQYDNSKKSTTPGNNGINIKVKNGQLHF